MNIECTSSVTFSDILVRKMYIILNDDNHYFNCYTKLIYYSARTSATLYHHPCATVVDPGLSSRDRWICRCIGTHFRTRLSFRRYLTPVKISWRYLKRFKSYHVDKQTDRQTHPQTDTTQNKNTTGRSDGGYIGMYTPKISNRFVHVWDINTCFEIAITS